MADQEPDGFAEYWTTDEDSPSHVYHDVLIALDESRGINNGQPSLWAYIFDHLDLVPGEQVLHLGCGTGYYSAIIAELVGSAGRVTAVEIDATLAQNARAALADWPQVRVINADGAHTSFEPVDAIVASAGATHPLSSWLDALEPGGRLLFPMTTSRNGPGAMLLVSRRPDDGFAARFLCRAGFIDFQGARDPAISRRLAAALRRDQGAAVKSLRRDTHTEMRLAGSMARVGACPVVNLTIEPPGTAPLHDNLGATRPILIPPISRSLPFRVGDCQFRPPHF